MHLKLTSQQYLTTTNQTLATVPVSRSMNATVTSFSTVMAVLSTSRLSTLKGWVAGANKMTRGEEISRKLFNVSYKNKKWSAV